MDVFPMFLIAEDLSEDDREVSGGLLLYAFSPSSRQSPSREKHPALYIVPSEGSCTGAKRL